MKKYGKDSDASFNMHNLIGNSQWALNLSKVAFSTLTFEATEVLIDQGFNYIAIPQQEAQRLYAEIKLFTLCTLQGLLLTCSCTDDSSLPPLVFTIDGIEYSIDSSKYQYYDNNQCIVYIVGQSKQWILGQIFLREYYSYWDMKNLRIGLTPAKKGSSGSSSSGDDLSSQWVVAIIVIITLLVAGGGIAVGYLLYKRKALRRDSDLSRASLISIDRDSKMIN